MLVISRRGRAGLGILVPCLLAFAGTAQAAPTGCGSRADIVAKLAGQYGERREAVGLADSGNLVEVLVAADGSTWTIIVTRPDGTSCLVAAGESWQPLKATAMADGPGV